jgi:ethanolamine utilization protein EutN
MRIGRVIGTVVCSQKVDSFLGKRLLLVQPLDEEGSPSGEPVVAIDTVSAGPGERVTFVEKREAAKAFPGPQIPSDVTILAIVDRLDIHS